MTQHVISYLIKQHPEKHPKGSSDKFRCLMEPSGWDVRCGVTRMKQHSSSMEIITKADRDLSEPERREIDDVCNQAFSDDDGYVWVDGNDWHVVVKLDGKAVSHVGILERTVTVAGQPVRLGGIGGVATLPEAQRRGLASLAMKCAGEFMRDNLKVDFGLLVCDPETIPFYRKAGWEQVPGPLIIDQPRGKVTFEGVTMVLPCVKQDWPLGVIDLCGLPW